MASGASEDQTASMWSHHRVLHGVQGPLQVSSEEMTENKESAAIWAYRHGTSATRVARITDKATPQCKAQ